LKWQFLYICLNLPSFFELERFHYSKDAAESLVTNRLTSAGAASANRWHKSGSLAAPSAASLWATKLQVLGLKVQAQERKFKRIKSLISLKMTPAAVRPNLGEWSASANMVESVSMCTLVMPLSAAVCKAKI
jgi:hypothetical protein